MDTTGFVMIGAWLVVLVGGIVTAVLLGRRRGDGDDSEG